MPKLYDLGPPASRLSGAIVLTLSAGLWALILVLMDVIIAALASLGD